MPLYRPVWTSAITGPANFALSFAVFGLLTSALTAAGGAAISARR